MNRAYFDSFVECFEQAAKRVTPKPEAKRYNFAARQVQFRIAGGSLEKQIALPFAHLQSSNSSKSKPELTISLWDVDATNVLPPEKPVFTASQVWQCEGGLFSTHADNRFVSFEQSNGETWLDRQSNHIIGWRKSAHTLSVYERSKPLPLLLSLWYGDQGIQIIHSGLVAHENIGFLIAGRSGTGKTTTCLSCLFGGLHFLGDDQVGIENRHDGSYIGHSLYNSTRLELKQLQQFSQLQEFIQEGKRVQDNKSLILAYDLIKDKLQKQVEVAAILFPQVSDGEPHLYPLKKSQALLKFAPSSLIISLGAGNLGFANLADLIEQVPSFTIQVNSDLARIPEIIKQLAGEVTSCA